MLVAELDNSVAGFAMFTEVDGCAYIEELDVLPAYAGRGIGAALIDQVGNWARRSGLKALTLSTFRDVPWNAPYYARLGFQLIAATDIGPGLTAICAEHAANGLNIRPRVCMRRLFGNDA